MIKILQKLLCDKLIHENENLVNESNYWKQQHSECKKEYEQQLTDRKMAYDYLYSQYIKLRDYVDGTNAPKPHKYTEFNNTALRSILSLYAGGSHKIHFADSIYYSISIDDFKLLLEYDLTNRNSYIAEKYDCDDFSFRLKGQFTIPGWSKIPMFIVWTDLHAFNCFVDDTRKLWIIEPQNDRIFEPSADMHEQYKNVKLIIG